MLLVGFLQVWCSLVGVGADRVEKVFTSEGGEFSCRCVFDGGYTHSQFVAIGGGEFEHELVRFESDADGCHAHCVGWWASDGWWASMMATELETLEVDDIGEEQ